MSSDWDPFKPVDFGKKENSFNAFEPSGSFDSKPSETWAMEAEREKASWAFQTNDSFSTGKSDSIHWSSGKQESGFYTSGQSAQSWGYSTPSAKEQSWFSSTKESNGDTLGFGGESEYQRLKESESLLNRSWCWEEADTRWNFESVNQSLENSGRIGAIESSRNSAFASANSSSWGFSPEPSAPPSLASSWVWETGGSSGSSGNEGTFSFWDQGSGLDSKQSSAFEPVDSEYTPGTPLKRW